MKLIDTTLDGLSSLLLTSVSVLGSAVAGPHSGVFLSGKGIGGTEDDDDDEGGETMTDAIPFGAPGIVFRPRPPQTKEGKTSFGDEIGLESFAARGPDGLQPLAYRDLRWNRNYPAPKIGDMALVGYAGGFISFQDFADSVPGEDEDEPPTAVTNQGLTVYVPYAKNAQGVPQKAMAFACDPDQESMSLIHGDGFALTMDPQNGIVMRSNNGSSFMQFLDGAFSVVANTISLQGNVALGANTQGAFPLLPGVASQPTPSVFFSPI